ncbi:putative DNA-helicase B-like isoform X1 [Sesbania bispinosa]|nr:putative DNA-helicase B-like isoform X1 [Sesbania bispinosa]
MVVSHSVLLNGGYGGAITVCALTSAIRHGHLACLWRGSAISTMAAVMEVTAWRVMAAVANMAPKWAFPPFFSGLGPGQTDPVKCQTKAPASSDEFCRRRCLRRHHLRLRQPQRDHLRRDSSDAALTESDSFSFSFSTQIFSDCSSTLRVGFDDVVECGSGHGHSREGRR